MNPLRLLKPPRFEDEEKDRVASLLNMVLLFCIGSMFTYIGVVALLRPALALHSAHLVTVIGLFGALVMSRLGYIRTVGIALVVAFWLLGVYALIVTGGIHEPGPYVFFVVIVMAGMLLGWREALAVSLASLVAVIAAYIGQVTGALPRPLFSGGTEMHLTTQVVGIILLGGLLALAAWGLQQALGQLRESEARFAELVRGSPDVIMSLDERGVVIDCNPATEDLVGVAPETLIGKHFSELGFMAVDELGDAERLFRELRSGRQAALVKNTLRMPNGEVRYVETNPSIIERPDGTVRYQFVIRNITARQRIIRERDTLQEQLRVSRKLEAMGRLAGGVAHDFNNLLTVILGNAELLKMHLEDKALERATEIETAASRAADLTRQLLVFARRQMLTPKVIDLNDLLKELQPLLARLLKENIELELELVPELGKVEADPSQIEQVVINLVTNAKDATQDGGKVLIRTMKSERAIDGDVRPWVSMEVEDYGHGMDEETRAHVFEPFFSTKGSLGTGLGLATVHGIVTQSGGFIEVDSAPGKGSIFRVHLPIVEGPEGAREGKNEVSPKGHETVLLVDDDELVRKVARQSLEDAGYLVLEVADGPSALETARAHDGPIDLLLTDVVMPQMSGPELADQLGALRPDLKVLFISGYPSESLAARSVTDKNVEFLHKPFTPKTLCTEVRKVLDT